MSAPSPEATTASTLPSAGCLTSKAAPPRARRPATAHVERHRRASKEPVDLRLDHAHSTPPFETHSVPSLWPTERRQGSPEVTILSPKFAAAPDRRPPVTLRVDEAFLESSTSASRTGRG